MSEPSAAPAQSSRRVPGKLFVPIFVVVLIGSSAMALVIAARMRPVVDAARRKTFPLGAQLNAACRPPGASAPANLRIGGRCDGNGTLELSVSDGGEAVKHIAYAIVGDRPGEPLASGQFAPGETASVRLKTLSEGPHVLVFVVSDQWPDMIELSKAIALAPPGDVPDRLVKVEQYGTVMRNRGADVRTDRIQFRIGQ